MTRIEEEGHKDIAGNVCKFKNFSFFFHSIVSLSLHTALILSDAIVLFCFEFFNIKNNNKLVYGPQKVKTQ